MSLTFKQRTYRQERALFNLVKASNALLDGEYAEALIWTGVAVIHISHLAGEAGIEKAYDFAKQLRKESAPSEEP